MPNSDYLLDNFVNVQPGQPYRLFPFGKIVKGGKARVITREFAATFSLPHFKPPIKMGSHKDETPAGGHIVGLEVRADGLYAVPEFNERGGQALADGAYRYHSPEVIWEDGGLEDPQTGAILAGPLIVGDALLHTPHLGEAAALYSVEPIERSQSMAEDTVQVPKSLWEKIEERFFSRRLPVEPEVETSKPEPAPASAPAPAVPEEFAAAIRERDDLKAKFAAIEAEKARLVVVTGLVAQLQNQEQFGMHYVELNKAQEAAEMMAGMTEEQRSWCMRNFSAMAAQITTSALFAENGTSGAGPSGDPATALDVAVKAKMASAKLGYVEAFEAIRVEQPDLVKAAAK